MGERPHIEPEQSAAAPPVRRRVRMRPPAREGRPFRRRGRDSAAPRQRAKRGGRGSPLLKTRVSGWPHPLDPHPGRGLPGGRPPTTSVLLGGRARGSPPAPSSAALGGTKGAGARRKAGGVGRRTSDNRRERRRVAVRGARRPPPAVPPSAAQRGPEPAVRRAEWGGGGWTVADDRREWGRMAACPALAPGSLLPRRRLRTGKRSGLGLFGCRARCPAPGEGARKDHPEGSRSRGWGFPSPTRPLLGNA